MSITIKEMSYTTIDQDTGREADVVTQYFVRDLETQVVLGTFIAESEADRNKVLAEALACKAQYEAEPWQSPFVRHRGKLTGCYGGA